MSKGDQNEWRFVETLSHDLASEVLEDETACEEALKLAPDPNAVIARVQQAAAHAIAKQRRERIAKLGEQHAETARQGRYGALDRSELLKLLEEREGAVEHRELSAMPDEDLRTLLDDLDALKER